MTLSIALMLVASGFAAGAVNAVAGGGTFLTFAALSLAGIPPVSANATSSITQFPGYVTSTLAYRRDFAQFLGPALGLALLSAAGAVCGALLLLALDDDGFRRLVPWLLIAATALFAAGPWLKPKHAHAVAVIGPVPGAVVQVLTAIYGGFFGAGMGVMMLATLGLTQAGDYHRLNALKNLLSIVIAAVAIVVFVSGGVVAWPEALVMIPAVAIGGYAGVYLARRVPQPVLRGFVITVGLALSAYYFAKG